MSIIHTGVVARVTDELRVSPDGTMCLTDNGNISYHVAQDMAAMIDAPGNKRSGRWSVCGRYVYIIGEDGAITIRHVKSGKQFKFRCRKRKHPRHVQRITVHDIVWSTDNRYMYLCCTLSRGYSNRMTIMDMQTQRSTCFHLKDAQGQPAYAHGARWLHNTHTLMIRDKYILTVGDNLDQICVRSIRAQTFHPQEYFQCWSPTLRYACYIAFVGYSNKRVRFVPRLSDNYLEQPSEGVVIRDDAANLIWTPDEKYVLIFGTHGLRVWCAPFDRPVMISENTLSFGSCAAGISMRKFCCWNDDRGPISQMVYLDLEPLDWLSLVRRCQS